MSFSDFLELEVLDHVFRNASYTPVATVYVALYTVTPSDTGGGTQVTGGAYARQAVTFGAAAAGAISNSVLITFPTATADWGTVVAFGIFDALTAGNLLAWAALTTQATINNTDTARYSVGDLAVTLN